MRHTSFSHKCCLQKPGLSQLISEYKISYLQEAVKTVIFVFALSSTLHVVSIYFFAEDIVLKTKMQHAYQTLTNIYT